MKTILKNKINQFQHFIKNHRLVFYLIVIMSFIISFGGTFAYGVSHRINNNTVATPLNKEEALSSNTNFKIVKQLYNPVNHLYRVDLYLNNTNGIDVDNQLSSVAIIESDVNYKAKINGIKVTPNYFVFYIKGLPNDYNAMKNTLRYTYREAGMTQKGEGTFITTNKTLTTDKGLKIEKNKAVLMGDSINYDIKNVKEDIEHQHQLIDKNKDTIKENKVAIDELNDAMQYQLGEELTTSKDKLDQLKSDNQTLLTENKEARDAIDLDHQKVALLQEKRAKILANHEK